MRRSLVLLLVAAAACSGDRDPVFEPTSGASATILPNTARVVLDGTEYEYGCPDFPCPVSDIVRQHIASGAWFWLEDGTFPHRAIYLVILRVPVQMKAVPDDDDEENPEPPTPKQPYLRGPNEVEAEILPPINQVTCGKFSLELRVKDGSAWEFVSGTLVYQYVKYNPVTEQWEPTGASSTVGIGAAAWSELLAGTYRLYPPFPNLEYYAHFTVNLKSGTTTAQVSHELLCHLALPPEPPTPPVIEGPTGLRGVRTPQPSGNLICYDIKLDLIASDPWDFVSGSQLLEYYAWDPVKKMYVKTGNSSTKALTAQDWADLLGGTYDTNPGVFTPDYYAKFTVTLAHGTYQHTLTHTLRCGSGEFLDNTGISAN